MGQSLTNRLTMLIALCLMAVCVSRTAASRAPTASIVYKQDDIARYNRTHGLVGKKISIILSVSPTAKVYFMRSKILEPLLPIIAGDPYFDLWYETSTYQLNDGQRLVQAVLTVSSPDVAHTWYPKFVAYDAPVGVLYDFFWIDEAGPGVEILKHLFSVEHCPDRVVSVAKQAKSPRTFRVELSSSRRPDVLYLSVELRTTIKQSVYYGTDLYADYVIKESDNGEFEAEAEDPQFRAGLLYEDVAVSVMKEGQYISVDVTVRREGLYSVYLGRAGFREEDKSTTHAVCHVQAVAEGKTSWFDGRSPELLVAGKQNKTRPYKGLSKQIFSAGAYFSCRAAGNPLPEIDITYHGACNPRSSDCPDSQLVPAQYVTTTQTAPDVVDKVYFFTYGNQPLGEKLGWYTCEARNHNGHDEEHFEVIPSNITMSVFWHDW